LAKIAFDTNILAYAAGLQTTPQDVRKGQIAETLIAELIRFQPIVIPAQTCAELHNLLIRKAGVTRAHATVIVAEYMDGAEIIPTDQSLLTKAFDLAAKHGLQSFDSIILAAAAEAGCDILYSEDMQNGFEWNGVMVVNPFE
jgi:predicted nucleic acid-binding protein